MTEQFAIEPMWLPVVIFCARVTDVSVGTLRLICIVRGHKPLAVILSFAEVLIWIFAVTKVLAHLDQTANILAFAGGYAAGSGVGMWIESRLALGMQLVTFLSKGRAQAVAERIRIADHRVTMLEGRNHDGPVALCHAVLLRKHTASAIRAARDVDPDVIVTVEDVRATVGGYTAGYGAGKTPWSLPRLALRPILARCQCVAGWARDADDPAAPCDGDDGPVSQAA